MSSRSSSNVPPVPSFLQRPRNLHALWAKAGSTAPAAQNHILISKSSPRPSVCNIFNTFDLRMCLAPQRMWCFYHFHIPPPRALFRHPVFQERSEPEVLFTFWLRNVLHARAACAFSTSQLPKKLRTPSVLNILTSKCVHATVACTFNSSPAKSAPNPRCF